ncbi:hypothetical protein, partial [Corynebacterium bovis]|uniref:hypothetical protein n=1 Tax=Corynebacterium bovis TaxID=36808 RepID=UPI001C8A80BB
SVDWERVSAQEAAKGVEDGTYFASLTVPADFSRSVATVPHARRGRPTARQRGFRTRSTGLFRRRRGVRVVDRPRGRAEHSWDPG